MPDPNRASDDQPTGGDAQGGSTLKEFQITVNGKSERFDLTNPEHQEELRRRAQQGTGYSQKVEALNQERTRLYKELKPYLEFDEILKRDQDLNALFTARIRGEPLPLERFGVRPAPRSNGDTGNGDGDDRVPADDRLASVRAELRGEFNAQTQTVLREVRQLGEAITNFTRSSQVSNDEQAIRSNPLYKGWLTDDHLAHARDAMERRGGTLLDNFKLLFFDEIPRLVERKVQSELPAEFRRTALTRDTAPVMVDGVRLTEDKIAELRKNPDQYAKFKKAIRAQKRARTGKIELPR